jgi:hypothetical protein
MSIIGGRRSERNAYQLKQTESYMTTVNNRSAALAFGLAIAAISSPSFAQSGDDEVSPERAAALRQCTSQEQKYPDYLWGDEEIQVYRECMAAHDQPE